MKNNKTIGITIRIWTNDLKVQNSKRNQGCWDSGVIMMEANNEKGIKAENPIPLGSFDDIVPAIRLLCRKNKILIVSEGGKPRLK